jgi:AdoMet-dependent rRNA methyltransferase SPB1
VFQPNKRRRKRDGYDDNDYTLFKKIAAGMFVKGTDPISVLGSVNKITFETEEEKAYVPSLGLGSSKSTSLQMAS